MNHASPRPALKPVIGWAILLAAGLFACAGGSSSPTAPTQSGHGGSWNLPGVEPPAPNHFEPIISENHWHKATLNVAQVMEGLPISMGIQGGADHGHGLEIDLANLARIGAYERVNLLSSTERGHNHWVTYN